MQQKIEQILNAFTAEIEKADSVTAVEAIKVKFLGRKGPVQALMQDLKGVSEAERPTVGKWINDLKQSLAQRCQESLNRLRALELEERLKREVVDITLPGRRQWQGRKHIVTQLLDQVIEVLIGMGFSVQEGPEVETDYYNFEALNFAADHPARDMQDTFYINSEMLLRTHTSNIQARVMEATKPPIRVICPGKVYRNEEITARSHVFFHQVEGFYINHNVSFSNLLATLDEFLHKLLGENIRIRYRPSYFPFVEPGMEVDVSCSLCSGSGCPMCKHTGWLEILGAGMIHPEVLKNGGIDPEEYSGYAWGMGIERLANIKYGVSDIRFYTENDMRFLRQFSGI